MSVAATVGTVLLACLAVYASFLTVAYYREVRAELLNSALVEPTMESVALDKVRAQYLDGCMDPWELEDAIEAVLTDRDGFAAALSAGAATWEDGEWQPPASCRPPKPYDPGVLYDRTPAPVDAAGRPLASPFRARDPGARNEVKRVEARLRLRVDALRRLDEQAGDRGFGDQQREAWNRLLDGCARDRERLDQLRAQEAILASRYALASHHAFPTVFLGEGERVIPLKGSGTWTWEGSDETY